MLRTLGRSIVVLSLLTGGVVRSADLSEPLRAEMSHRSPNEMIPVIAILKDRVDLVALDERLDRMNATRRARHEIVVRALQEKAASTQWAVLEELSRLSASGRVQGFQSLWITNGILLEANHDGILALARNEALEGLYFGGHELISHGSKGLTVPVPSSGSTQTAAQSIEPGLKDIHADFLWGLGYDGTGRLVSHLDTGVEGSHPALQNWRGNDPGVSPTEAWFDPLTHTTSPTRGGSFGTHSMGTLCGSDANNIVGVAWGAKWISAWVIDRAGTSRSIADALLAFQWTTDPDGNPATITDVPDCSSNSWGFSFLHGIPACDATFWEAIDGCESAGVAVVFSAGNERFSGLRTPADRISSSTNAWAVGSLFPGSTSIGFNSSRGPSGCDNVTIKPEICAQGENVRSSWPGGAYALASGTGVAAPHAAGSVALLRQVNPNLSSHRVKEIINETADDLGPAGEDNNYGHGRINLINAYNQVLAEMPAVSVSMVTNQYIAALGSSEPYFLTLINHSGARQPVDLRVEVRDAANNLIVTLLSLPGVNIPAGFNNDASPIGLTAPVPASVPPAVYNVPLTARTTLSVPGTSQVISSAEFEFVIR